MWLLVIGLVLVVLKFAEAPVVGGWPWWLVLLPFAATILWWIFADMTGLTARRLQQRWDDKREKRRRDAIDNLHGRPAVGGGRVQSHDPNAEDRR